jgi:hypothetical protein
MVSTAMQGGCTCENASLLRVNTGNVEFAALFAPKPLGMTAANDWTKEMESKGYPELQRHYAMMGAPNNVALWAHLNFGHNYNIVSREHIYAWFNEHFHLGLSGDRLKEQDHPVVSKDQLTVWDDQHPQPPQGDDFERKLLHWWAEDAEAQLKKSPESLEKIARPAWKALIGWQGYHTGSTLEHLRRFKVSGGGQAYDATIFTLRDSKAGVDLPTLEVAPPAGKYNGRLAIWLDQRGKAGLFTAEGELRPEVRRLLDAGWRVNGVDLFEQGEFLRNGQPVTQTRRVKNPREAGCFTFGYNSALFAQRVQDICEQLAMRGEGKEVPKRTLIALDETGPLAAVALAVMPDKIESAAINTGGFRFGKVLDLWSPGFLPAGAKYGDLPGAVTLAKQNAASLLVLGEGESSGDPVEWVLAH